MHYPPISNQYINNEFEKKIVNLLNEYNIKLCLYGHLHGNSHAGAIIGKRDDIEYKLVSADYLGFKLLKIMQSALYLRNKSYIIVVERKGIL